MSRRRGLVTAAVMIAVIAIAAGATATWMGLALRTQTRANANQIGGPFTLVDDTGAQVSEAVLKGKPTVMYFGYTFCPEICPTTLTELAQWMQILGPDADKLNYVFVTVDPERDTPKVMHDYVTAFDARIRGFTGTPDQIAKVTREYRVYYKRTPTSDGGYAIDHTAGLYLVDPTVRFFGLIPYQEKTDVAVAKLRRLIAAAASS
jgi:protein SCO1